jgi:hypothetical protein
MSTFLAVYFQTVMEFQSTIYTYNQAYIINVTKTASVGFSLCCKFDSIYDCDQNMPK